MSKRSALSLAFAAVTIGFVDPLYFSRKFRAFTGEDPTTYRRRYGGREG